MSSSQALGIPRGIIEEVARVSVNPSKSGVRELRRRSPLFALQRAQSDKEVLVNSQLLFSLAVRARHPYSRRWAEWYDWTRGLQWPVERPSWRSRATANYIFVNQFSKGALLTDARPIVKALPRKSSDRNLVSGYINPMLEWAWGFDRMDSKLMETVIGMLQYGTYFLKPMWDPSLMNGQGMLMTEMVDPAFAYPDPGGTSMRDLEFFAQAQPLSLERIARLWPEHGEKVEPEDITLDHFSARDRSSMFSRTSHHPLHRKPVIGLARLVDRARNRAVEPEPGVDIDRALAVELYIKQNVNREVVNPDTGKREEIIYPQGRRLVWANGVLLADEPWQSERLPFIKLRDYVWPGEFWGGGETEQLISLQREMNKIRAHISDLIMNQTNPKIVMDKGAVDRNLLTTKPNAIIEKKRGSEFRFEQGLALPAGMHQTQAQQQSDFENVSGSQDVNQGRVPDRISSGKAIELVAEAAQNRIRLTERLIAEGLEEWADQAMVVMRQNITAERTIRVTGERGKAEFRKITPQMLENEFDFEAAVGSQILRGRQRFNVNEVLGLLEAGVIDPEAALEVIDFPEAKATLERVMAARAEAARFAQQNPGLAGQGASPQLGVVQGGGA